MQKYFVLIVMHIYFEKKNQQIKYAFNVTNIRKKHLWIKFYLVVHKITSYMSLRVKYSAACMAKINTDI